MFEDSTCNINYFFPFVLFLDLDDRDVSSHDEDEDNEVNEKQDDSVCCDSSLFEYLTLKKDIKWRRKPFDPPILPASVSNANKEYLFSDKSPLDYFEKICRGK